MNGESLHLVESDEIDITRALAPDNLLASIVDRVNAGGGEKGPEITIVVGGQVIGGTLVSARDWIDSQPDAASAGAEAGSRAFFLHLQRARIPNGTGVREIGDTRARLNEIASWSLHSLTG